MNNKPPNWKHRLLKRKRCRVQGCRRQRVGVFPFIVGGYVGMCQKHHDEYRTNGPLLLKPHQPPQEPE